jgi:chemotaxis protein histidine kinase CheA
VTLNVDNGFSLELSLAFAKGGKGGGHGNNKEGVNGPNGGPFAKGKGANKASRGRGGGPASIRSMDTAGVGANAFGRLNTNNLGNSRRAVAATLGRLNAAHASANARAHAAANSTVGLLATYESAVKDGRALTEQADTLNDQVAALEADLAALDMTALEQSASETAANAERTTEAYASARAEADALATAAEAARIEAENDPTNLALAESAAAAEAAATEAAATAESLAAEAENAQQTADDAQAELAAAAEKVAATEEALASTQSELAGVEDSIDAAAEVEAESLAAAANKPITDEVTAAVNTLLGLDDSGMVTAGLEPEDSGSGITDSGLEQGSEIGSEDAFSESGGEGEEAGKHPNAGLGNGGEDGDPGQSGWHNAVSRLDRGIAAGELDDTRELQ